MKLAELLSETPNGRINLSDAEAITWLGRYLAPMGDDATRIKDAQERSDLYRDRGAKYISALIDHVFEDPDVKLKRDKWVEQAGYNNVTRRIVGELATLYRRPARRSVDNLRDDVRYQTVQQIVRLNAAMLEVQRLAILHRSLLVGFRVQSWGLKLPRLDVVEPQNFRLVAHPLEPTRLIAVIIDQGIETPGLPGVDRPAYLVWTEGEWFRLTAGGRLYGEIKPHTLGRIPYVLVAVSPPPGQLIDCHTFRDVIRAHKAVWFENVLLLKESKSATRTTVLSGDLARVARKQALDTEAGIALPAGVGLTPVDMSMDLTLFRDTADHILERAAANHGIPPAILRHDGATSGYEIELRYVGIRERRVEQEGLFRAVERELAELMAAVLAEERPDLAFSPEGWAINFGDTEMPRHPKEALEIYEHASRLGLRDIIEEEMSRDPDLTTEDAWSLVKERISNKLRQNKLMRPLAEMSGQDQGKPEDAEAMGEEESPPNGKPRMLQ